MQLKLTASVAVTQERCRTLVEGRNREGAEKLMSLLRLKHRKVSRPPLGTASRISWHSHIVALLSRFLCVRACVRA